MIERPGRQALTSVPVQGALVKNLAILVHFPAIEVYDTQSLPKALRPLRFASQVPFLAAEIPKGRRVGRYSGLVQRVEYLFNAVEGSGQRHDGVIGGVLDAQARPVPQRQHWLNSTESPKADQS